MRLEIEEAKRESLRAIVVAGIASGAGKTSVAEAVTRISARARLTSAAKITVTHGERGCPHGGKGCNVCSSLGGDFQIITRDSIINQPGTDTARLFAAGGSPVVWAITRDVSIKDAWQAMSSHLAEAVCAVIESNTLAEQIRPALTLMIVDPTVSRKIWKPSAERLIATADFVIFNDRGTQAQKAIMQKELERLRPGTKDYLCVSHPRDIENHTVIVQSIAGLFESDEN